jgi:hypothetical protein
MNTFKSILSICFLVFVGIAIGQTSFGKTLFNESVFWMKNNPVNNGIKSVVEKTKDQTVKVQKKIENKYQEVKAKVKEEVGSKSEQKEASVPKDYKGMKIHQAIVKGKSVFIVADKDGFRCEHLSSPSSKYSRCYKKVSSK